MKYVFTLIISVCAFFAQAQYKYYFFQIKITGKSEVQLIPEREILYPDIESLIIEKRDTSKKGTETVTAIRFQSYSEAFNKLSAAGLEFVQFTNLPTVGAGTAFLAGDMRVNYIIWRKKI